VPPSCVGRMAAECTTWRLSVSHDPETFGGRNTFTPQALAVASPAQEHLPVELYPSSRRIHCGRNGYLSNEPGEEAVAVLLNGEIDRSHISPKVPNPAAKPPAVSREFLAFLSRGG
jgi:hypothetical protein